MSFSYNQIIETGNIIIFLLQKSITVGLDSEKYEIGEIGDTYLYRQSRAWWNNKIYKLDNLELKSVYEIRY